MNSSSKNNNPVIMLQQSQKSTTDKYCSYPHRHCLLHPLKGYEYCIQHILEDKTSPYKLCSYVHHKTGRRCPNAAPKIDKKEGTFCSEHQKKVSMLRRQALKTKRIFPDSVETVIMDIEQNNEEIRKAEAMNQPPPKAISNLHVTDSYQTDSDSDKEPMPVEDIFRGDAESDAESLDSDQEDPLKHAGVYTNIEAATILREKLIRLQSLYIGQFKRLQHVLKERRRKYLKAVKQERELYGSISSCIKSGSEMKTYQKLRALNKYHCKRGEHSLVLIQNKEKRLAQTEGASYKPPASVKCINLEDSIRCTNSPMPFSKYCLKHILNDANQMLFKPCQYADTGCKKVIVPVQEDSRCILHVSLPETVEPLTKTMPQGASDSPKVYPGVMSDIDKLLGDPDQFLSSFSSTFSGDTTNISTPSYSQVSSPFIDPTSINKPMTPPVTVPVSTQRTDNKLDSFNLKILGDSNSDGSINFTNVIDSASITPAFVSSVQSTTTVTHDPVQ